MTLRSANGRPTRACRWKPADGIHDRAAFRAHRRGSPWHRSDQTDRLGHPSPAQSRFCRTFGAGISRPAFDAAPAGLGSGPIWGGFPATQFALRAARMSAGPLHLEPGFLPGRPPLHSGRRLSHGPFECGPPPKATVLHAVSLPDRGGDTQYVNMHVAFDELPRETKRRIEGLKAIHVYQSRFSTRKLMELSSESRGGVPDLVTHPIVRTHPKSGRKAIYINPIRTEGIVGMRQGEA